MNGPCRWLVSSCRQGLPNKVRTSPVTEAFIIRIVAQMLYEFVDLDGCHRCT
jgi:hypothetical protein